jgi:hypothetical protein
MTQHFRHKMLFMTNFVLNMTLYFCHTKPFFCSGGRWRGSRFARAEQVRGRGSWAEGATERGEVGEQGTGLKWVAEARTWPENVRSWARPWREIVGESLGTS